MGDGEMKTHLLTTIKYAAMAALLGLATPRGSPAMADVLQLEAKIPLGSVTGRIDHLAIDLARHRLFVSELGNDSVGVVDLKDDKVVRTITGLKEPQGVGYAASTDTLYVANAGDGSVRLYRGAEYMPEGKIDLGADADNIRIDAAGSRVLVGYGAGALAVIDPVARTKVADIPLRAHPEGFQLDTASNRVFVNVPNEREIAVGDRETGKQIANWPMRTASANFPMALDTESKRVLAVFRSPPQLAAFAMDSGKLVSTLATCGDSDDLFVDAKRHRIYVSCGTGFIDVVEVQGDTYQRQAHMITVSGARTSLFVPELDRLFLAVRAQPGEPAAIWVFRPLP
jgi:YVTN family beta-propeller protein